ncbi:MAG: glycoside hydrolase family 30 beta sandwich domain-containing protein [Planctomycetota bacterium]
MAVLGTLDAQGQVQAWVSSADQSQLLNQGADTQFNPGSGSSVLKINVDPATTYQTMTGFGASMSESSAWLITERMNQAQRDALMTDLFDADQGIGINYLRVPMGASDFALSPYTYNDQPGNQPDIDQSDFSLARDDAYVVPALQAATAVNPDLLLMGTPWSPPAWMKDSGQLNGGTLLPQYYDSYAQYFVKFVEGYEARGLNVHAITTQNEPLFEPSNYPSSGMSSAQQAAFIGDALGPAFDAAGIDTKIIAFDHNWIDWQYPVDVLNDPEANQYTAGAAFHGYAGNVDQQSLFRNAHPDREVHYTEITGGDFAPNFGDNLLYSFTESIIGATRNWATTSLYWNVALNEDGGPRLFPGSDCCRGMVTIDDDTGLVTFNEEYYAYAHASKFVQRGAVRIASDSFDNVFESVAFENPDGSRVLIGVNLGGVGRNIDVVVDGESFTYFVPARSGVTFTWPGAVIAIEGDANGDGVVDLLDFDILAQNFGAGPGAVGGETIGDFNADGAVNLLDFDVLAQNFGATAPAVVPEPASFALLLGAGWGLCGGLGRRRRPAPGSPAAREDARRNRDTQTTPA